MSLTRRQLLAGVAGATGLVLAPTRRRAYSAGRTDTAVQSWDLLRGFTGVCCKTGDAAPWNRTSDLVEAMRGAGMTWMRTPEVRVEQLTTYAAAGIRLQIIAGKPTDKGGPEAVVAAAAPLAAQVMAFEGANEWNLTERPDWAAELLQHQTRLYMAVKSTHALSGARVVAPSMGKLMDWETFGFHPEICNVGNTHVYSGGSIPEKKAQNALDGPAAVCGGLPVVVTETGWHNAKSWTGTHYYTPEDVAAVYAPRTVLDFFRRGAARLSFYALADAGPESSGEREDHFGLVDYSLRPKRQYTALANLATVMGRLNQAGSVTSLTRTVTGPDDLHTVAVVSTTGRAMLFVWREAAIYEPVHRKYLDPGVRPVRIDWGTTRQVGIYNPTRSDSQIGESHSSSTTLSLGAELLALDIAT